VVCSRGTPLGFARHHVDLYGLVERAGNSLEEPEGVAPEIIVLKISDWCTEAADH
jgi:hypothetical protein